MFFTNFVRSKLASFLQPWLDEEPELELKLGFLKSIISAKNLSLNPSVLNPLTEKSTRLVFERVKIEGLSIRISPWSFPSLILDVRGVDVILTPREPVVDRRVPRDVAMKKRKELIAALDPEGVSLHEIIERILVRVSSGNRQTTTLANVMLRCCRIQFTDIYIQLQIINESHACMLKVDGFSLEPQCFYQSSLFRGLVGLLLIVEEETALAFSSSCMEFGLKENDHANWLTSLMGLSACVRLNDLQPSDYAISIPHVYGKISPTNIPLILVLLDVLSFKENFKADRNGQELWKIAAERIFPLIRTSKLSLRKLVNIVLLWSRYIRTYESLLSMIGYYASSTLKEHLAVLSGDRKHLSLVTHQCKYVNELEEKLPAEAVACARRVARHRALSHSNSPDLKSHTGFITSLLLKIVNLLLLLWKVIRFIFLSAVQLSFMGKISSARQGINALPVLGGVSSDVIQGDSELHFSLSLGEVDITLSHANDDSGVNLRKLKFVSFHFIVRCFCVDYTADISTSAFFVALGELKLCLPSISRDPLIRSNVRGRRNPSLKGLELVEGDELNIILWGDPAPLHYPFEDDAANPSDTVESALTFSLQNSITDLRSNWKKIGTKYNEMNVKYKEQPFILCEIKNSLMGPCIRQGRYGLCKCSLALGKLNFDLEYSSILSTTQLIKQVQHYHQLAAIVGRSHSRSHSSVLVENSRIGGDNRAEMYTHRMKEIMFNTIPDKNIQIGALLAGPSIRISSQNKLLGTAEEDCGPPIAQGSYHYCFTFDIENVEFAVWPASKDVLAQITGESSLNEAPFEYLWLKEPRRVDIPSPQSNEIFLCQGRIALDAYLRFNGLTVIVDDLEVTQQSRILEPWSITLHCSTCRDYHHSVTATVNILSVAMNAFTAGATVFLYMDELWTFLQIFEGIFSVVLSASNCFDPASLGYSQDFIRKMLTLARRNTERKMVESEAIARTMIIRNTQILIDATFELEAMDVILNDSRGKLSTGTVMNSDGASSSTTTYLSKLPGGKKYKIREMLDWPGFGVGFFIKRFRAQISGEGNHLDILIDFFGIESVMFSCQSALEVCTGTFQVKNLHEESPACVYRLSNCIFSIHIGSVGAILSSENVGDAIDGFDSSSYSGSVTHTEGSKPQIHCPDHVLEVCQFLTTMTPEAASGCWLLVGIQLGNIYLSENCMERFARARQAKKLEILIYICKDLHTVNCNIQGGDVFLESSALAMFAPCLESYFMLISRHPLLSLSDLRESFREDQLTTKNPKNISSGVDVFGSVPLGSLPETGIPFNWVFFQEFAVDLSQFSITLAGKNGSEGGVQELILEVNMRLKCLTLERKIIFNLNRFTIFTQQLHRCTQYKSKDPLIPHFRPSTSVTLPSQTRSGNHTFPSQCADSVPATLDAQSTNSPAFLRENYVEEGVSDSACHASYILKHMSASIMIEKKISEREIGYVLSKSDFVGNGSISGVELTLTSYEIQMISSLFQPFSGIFGGMGSQDKEQSVSSRIQEWNTVPDRTIPDGAIVAIKDLHEHMYLAVEAVDNKYRVVGVLHYTLVSERALFRVKYHKGWMSKVSRISLISLFAKNNHGEPLRLNFSPGSGFVEISSSDDKRQALWQTFPYKFKSFEDDDDIKSYSTSSRTAFYLVNQKNDCAIAFVDGLLEFVKKPGNPLKAKVLNEFSLRNGRRLNVSNGCSRVIPDIDSREGSSPVSREVSDSGSKHPHVNITIDKVTLTIFHEISDASGKIPIICGSINDISIIGQIMSSKMRIISSFNISIQYMDAHRNLWRDVVSPVASSLFFHSRFTFLDASNVYQGVPAHLFFNMRQVDLALTEISVDILLYLVGKLNIAGPYAVRKSIIFPNCCKLENHSGVSLLCHFSDNQVVKLAGKQSDSVFLRHIATEDHFQQRESSVSVCLCEEGIFSTSPINILLSNVCFYAWRTRAISLRDSRTFPGPFIVVEVSQKTEEGLCLCVSPLLRISNETGFSMELCFRRPQEIGECATILLRSGDTVDDSVAAFDAFELSGGSKRALMSLALGNFQLSVKPEIDENIKNNGKSVLVEWSEDLQGSKALCMSGIFDKLNYRFRKVLGVKSVKSFFSTLCCPLIVEGQRFSDLHFLVQTIGRDVPVMHPPDIGGTSEVGTSPVALLVQKEIFIHPTVQIHNLLQVEILVHVTENDPDHSMTKYGNYIGKQTTIPCESSAFLYANPAIMYFMVTLTAYSSRCKPVSSADWVEKLHKQKTEAHYIDTELDFGGGKYFASLRLSIADKGFLEVTIFSSYTFQNNTDFPLLFYASNQKPLPWEEIQKYSSNLPPELGCLLPQKSIGSWFLKSRKVHLKRFEEKGSASLLDLDVLSGFTEISLEAQDDIGFSRMTKLGVSLQPCPQRAHVPSQVICIVPRYIIANESKEPIFIRQCYLQDDFGEIIPVEGKQKTTLQIRMKIMKRKDRSILDSVLKRHRNLDENSQVFIQFCLKEDGSSWSGPVCVASLGRFFLKFKRSAATLTDQSNPTSLKQKKSTQFALIQIVEGCSSLVLHFYFPAKVALPYRIENRLHGSSIIYHQKDSVDFDMLEPGDFVEYAWDDLNLSHRLVVEVTDMQLVREINIDKICSWKPLFKMRGHNGMVMQLPLGKGLGAGRGTEESHGLEVFKVGYEVFADGPTRVLRICDGADSYKEEKVHQPCIGFQFRVLNFALHLLEKNKQDVDASGMLICSTIIVARLANIALDSLMTDRFKHYSIVVQSLNVDEKWQGAPFASMIRRSQIHDSGSTENILHIVFVLKSTNSNVKEVIYSSIRLQPIDLKVDEETLTRLVPFWRTSLSTSRTQSQQFYFKHFEIHPIKITASFLPGSPYSSYSSAQETLRSFLHSVIKVPVVNNKVVELNGILLTHAFVTFRELLLKCAQHYSWYIVRAIYIAKGSQLLPPAFVSIFDDTASSSLDVFFDASDGSISLPGLTLGMFKFISKCIDSKGFSGTKRYFGDLGKTIRIAGSNALFAAVTEISDNILKGAEAGGFNGMVNGFHQGILRLAMEPSLLGAAVLEGGPDRKIKLDRSPGVDELYIEGYLQAMLDVMYRQEYLRVRVIDNQVVLKNLPPNSSVINEIVENVKSFLVSKALLKGDTSMASRPLRHLRTESEWRIGPTVLTLCEHLFVGFTIRMLRKQANKFTVGIRWKLNSKNEGVASSDESQQKPSRKWAIGKFVFSGMIAYLDGRLCRHIPNPIARRIVSGFLLSYLDNKEGQ